MTYAGGLNYAAAAGFEISFSVPRLGAGRGDGRQGALKVGGDIGGERSSGELYSGRRKNFVDALRMALHSRGGNSN